MSNATVAAASSTDLYVESLAGMATVLLMMGAGAFLAAFPRGDPYLRKHFLQDASRLAMDVLWTVTAVYSIGSTLNSSHVELMLPLVVFSWLNLLLSGVLGAVGCALCNAPPRFAPALVVESIHGNSFALPMVLMSALCEQPALAEVESCVEKSIAMGMIYTIPWTICFFAISVPMLRGCAADEEEGEKGEEGGGEAETPWADPEAVALTAKGSPADKTEETENEDAANNNGGGTFRHIYVPFSCAALKQLLSHKPMLGTALGLLIAMVRPLQELIFEGALQPVGITLKTLTSPMVCLMTLIMAASIIPQAAEAGPAAAAAAARSTGGGGGANDERDPKEYPRSVVVKLALMLTVVKLVLSPLLNAPLIRACPTATTCNSGGGAEKLSPDAKLAALLCLVEAAVPSAQMGITQLHKMKMSEMATSLARVLLLQYLAATVLLTVMVGWALGVLEEL